MKHGIRLPFIGAARQNDSASGWIHRSRGNNPARLRVSDQPCTVAVEMVGDGLRRD